MRIFFAEMAERFKGGSAAPRAMVNECGFAA
jgi:hypothetical protein